MHATMQQTRSRRALLPWALLIVLVAGAAAAGDPSGAWGAEAEIVARVNGEPVTRAEWQRMVADPFMRRLHQREQRELKVQKEDRKGLAQWALQKLIIQRLTLQEAARRNITVAEQDLDRAVALWMARMKGPKKVQKYLKSRALDEKSLRETIRTDMLVTRFKIALVQGVRVTEEQVQEYYEVHKPDLRLPEEVRLRVIAVKDKAAADEIVAAVQKGEDFDRLARERSSESRAAEIGDGRWLAVPGLPAPLRAAIDPLKPGEISAPVQGSAEVMVVRLEERRPERAKTLAEAQAGDRGTPPAGEAAGGPSGLGGRAGKEGEDRGVRPGRTGPSRLQILRPMTAPERRAARHVPPQKRSWRPGSRPRNSRPRSRCSPDGIGRRPMGGRDPLPDQPWG